MAKIRVTCPACHDTLEVDDEHVGKEVECGSCLQPFTVADPAAKKPKKYKMRRSESEDADDEDEKPAAKRPGPRKRRRRDDDDDDLYDEPRRRQSGGSSVASVTLGTTSLLVGLVALVGSCCVPFGIVLGITAMVLAGKARSDPVGRPMAIIGSILGSLAVLLSIGFAVWLFQGGFNQVR
jgi:predicted Zn finger-like uncharacterized protein